MSLLSDEEIQTKAEKNGDVRVWNSFYGVFPIDKLPQFIPYLPILIVVNTDTHNLSGQHWKTIFIDRNRYGEVFDSLSQPMNDLLIQWLNRFTRRWKKNRKVYQQATTTTCGAFALFFILNRFDYPSLESFTQQNFSRSLYENESLVRSFYKKLK